MKTNKIDVIIKINKVIDSSFLSTHIETCYKLVAYFYLIYKDEEIKNEFLIKLKNKLNKLQTN